MRLIALALALLLSAVPLSATVISGAPLSGSPSSPVGPSLDFSQSPRQMRASYLEATATLQGALAKIAAVPQAEAGFGNTVKAFEDATAAWQREIQPIFFLSSVSPDKAVRDAAQELELEAMGASIDLGFREDLYALFEAAAKKGEALDVADARLLEATLKGFRENGLGLPPEQRERVRALQKSLSDLSLSFSRNIDESDGWLEVDEAGLDGLPQDYVSGLERTPEGKYKITLDYPGYQPFMARAKSAPLRRALAVKYMNRAMPENLPILKEVLRQRRELAGLLGYASFPALNLKDRMAKTPERVAAFLGRIKDAVVERARRDVAALLEVKRRNDPSATAIESWDASYYERALREERYALDSEEVKQYFPVDRVISGVLGVYQRVLGVRFQELKNGPKWHPDVRLFQINDAADGRLIGYFYLDLFPREGKYKHYAEFPMINGRVLPDGSYEPAVAAMVGNFPKPTPGKPALLTHGDVETFFHEFGHVMHQTLTTARYGSFSGTSVARDFVEAPSQMMERFAWEKSVLDEVSGHWRTGETLPKELFDKMVAAKGFNRGYFYARQLALAASDMMLHTVVPDGVSEAFNKLMAEISGIPALPGGNMVASFGHLMGYGAGYYSYLWSEVFADDIYTRFAADGVISPRVGAEYRREILERGSERPEDESLRAFLGREPNEEAFLRKLREASEPGA